MKNYEFVPAPEGDVNQGWALLAVTWAFVLTAFATIVVRIFVRARLTRNLGADDYTIVVAMVGLFYSFLPQASKKVGIFGLEEANAS